MPLSYPFPCFLPPPGAWPPHPCTCKLGPPKLARALYMRTWPPFFLVLRLAPRLPYLRTWPPEVGPGLVPGILTRAKRPGGGGYIFQAGLPHFLTPSLFSNTFEGGGPKTVCHFQGGLVPHFLTLGGLTTRGRGCSILRHFEKLLTVCLMWSFFGWGFHWMRGALAATSPCPALTR